MEKVNQVFKTNDYSRFKFITGNRKLNEMHIQRLVKSFQEQHLFNIIIVNQHFEIIDGQHRVKAAEQLGLPLWFVIVDNYGLPEIHTYNTNMKNWHKEDYLNGYCDLGYPEYLKFRMFMQEYPEFTINTAGVLLTQSTHGTGGGTRAGEPKDKYFQEGRLVIPDYDKSVEYAEKIRMIKPYYDKYHSTWFVATMIRLFGNENYSHSRFLSKLKIQPTALQDCRGINAYILLIEDIYNYHSRDKVSLRY